MSQPEIIKKEWSHEHWLTVKEIAALYNRSERTIERWCEDGTLYEFKFSVLSISPRRRYIQQPTR